MWVVRVVWVVWVVWVVRDVWVVRAVRVVRAVWAMWICKPLLFSFMYFDANAVLNWTVSRFVFGLPFRFVKRLLCGSLCGFVWGGYKCVLPWYYPDRVIPARKGQCI